MTHPTVPSRSDPQLPIDWVRSQFPALSGDWVLMDNAGGSAPLAGVIDRIADYAMQIVIDDRLPRDLDDMSATLKKVKAMKPDLLLVSGHAMGATTAARQIESMNIDVPMIAVTHCESAELINQFAFAVNGFLCPTQWSETLGYRDELFGSAADYARLFKTRYPNYTTVPNQSAQASAAVMSS